MLAALRADGDVLLERRPESGIWGGLWCLPEFTSAAEAAYYARRMLQGAPARPVPLEPVEHAFTHFDLLITPLLAHCAGNARQPRADCLERPAKSSAPAPDGPEGARPGTDRATLWYRARGPAKLGLPAPIRRLLERLAGAPRPQAQLFD